ncbi:Acyl dehydratase [Variovorax sp. HW608]|uniref:MaoC family dehydratase n=1 Tax=Variovorax sp. HW608 TaxID=1034889 RepID=UPI000820022E|nr:MaoC family dehydratase [Variovorax sp. HW608]SCK31075.1 Acyl dehydratase [Variovorax sp. HW608]
MSFPEHLELRCGPVTAVDLALFAAAAGDHNPLHLDVEAARAAGFDKPVVHGMLTMAYTARMFTRSFGAGSVRHLDTRFTGVARLGDTVALRATLSGIEDGCAIYALTARAEGGGELMTGSARIVQDTPEARE